jgi:5'-nucleotidase
MRFLVANDDGIHAAGIAALVEAVSPLGEVFVAAPDREQSAASHAISLHRPLRLHELKPNWWSIDGTPTDCVYLAMNHLLVGKRPDLVLSGINRGPNLGDDVTYSGTVAAAMEGALFGVPSVAFSLVSPSRKYDYQPALVFIRSLVRTLIAKPLPTGALLNVNIPEGPVKGHAWTRMGKRSYGQLVEARRDPRGRAYYWIGGTENAHENIPGSDCNAVYDDGLVSITPLHLDLTHHRLLEELRNLSIPLE